MESVKTLIEHHEHTSPSALLPFFSSYRHWPSEKSQINLCTPVPISKSLLHREPDLRRIPALNCCRLLQVKSLGPRGTPVGSKLCSPLLVTGFLVLPSLHLCTASRACAATLVWIQCWLFNHQYSLSKTRMCREWLLEQRPRRSSELDVLCAQGNRDVIHFLEASLPTSTYCLTTHKSVTTSIALSRKCVLFCYKVKLGGYRENVLCSELNCIFLPWLSLVIFGRMFKYLML